MEKISAVVITYNEEKNIERCINSLLPAVEEIIVVDSFSTDGTEEICSKFEKVHFYQRKFDGFSSQKNWAFGKISFPIVLSLDADEVISEELLKSINSAKKSGPMMVTSVTGSLTTVENGFETGDGILIQSCVFGI